jgi:hypothetical protein
VFRFGKDVESQRDLSRHEFCHITRKDPRSAIIVPVSLFNGSLDGLRRRTKSKHTNCVVGRYGEPVSSTLGFQSYK